ncbi:MAG: NAD(P)-dependent oxidoreductase [Rhodococcus sp. (in: high G+C Gram-positive bacteria)]|uniref:NAD-dependent epimerase/dehydratase family protein n=1 Tax=Rhodococcus sp. TaxID=1831 RepID=UPI003BAFF51F
MKVAVTGAAGFVGNNPVHLLVEAGHEVIAVDRVRSPCAPEDGVSWVNGDVLEESRDKLVHHALGLDPAGIANAAPPAAYVCSTYRPQVGRAHMKLHPIRERSPSADCGDSDR